MRNLDLLRSDPAGRAFLEEELTFDDYGSFLAHLGPPRTGTSTRPRVYSHQQVYLDYRSSVVAKMQALRELGSAGVRTDFVWIDTDRAGSDKLSLRVYLPGRHGPVPVRFAPPGSENRESRVIRTDPVRLGQAFDRMLAVVRSAPATDAALQRLRQLGPLIQAGGTLSELNRRVTHFLQEQVLAFTARPVLVSELVESGSLTESFDTILNRLPEFVATFNERIRTLRSLGIDPKVRPIAEGYLPLFVTRPGDRRRTRLRLVREGRLHLGSMLDADGRDHRYPLGRQRLSVEHLGADVSFSPDVTLPILLNDQYSGMVCGKSSALYLLVFADVMRKVLGMAPIPVFVPARWDVFGDHFDSLLVAYLDGRTV